MKNFFRVTSLKVILSFVILIIAALGFLLHRSIFSVSETGIEVKQNVAIEALYQASNIILFPVRLISNTVIGDFTKNYTTGTEIPPSNPINSGLLFLIFFFLPLLIEVYVISCIIDFLIALAAKKSKPDANNL
jgi:hypothetical protein